MPTKILKDEEMSVDEMLSLEFVDLCSHLGHTPEEAIKIVAKAVADHEHIENINHSPVKQDMKEENGENVSVIIDKAYEFGKVLDKTFKDKSGLIPFTEVKQFRALIESFAMLGNGFHVEEYHGSKHQVYFNGKWRSSLSRCELCDVLIVSYSLNGGFRGRVTFLQAKLSHDAHSEIGKSDPNNADLLKFKANLEQWDLLSRRPDILPVPPFQIHPKLLSSALLASVGSFGVFRKTEDVVDLFYSSADELSVDGAPKTKNARLRTKGSDRQREIGEHRETTYCPSLLAFGEALYKLEIGTPLESGSSDEGQRVNQRPLQNWIRNILSFCIKEGENESIARELRYHLPADKDDNPAPLKSIPNVLIIKSDMEKVERE